MMRSIFCKVGGNAQVTEEHSPIIIYKKISSFNVSMDESIDVEIVQPFEGLSQNTAYDIFFHASWPPVTHNVSGTAFVHETESDVKFVTIHP